MYFSLSSFHPQLSSPNSYPHKNFSVPVLSPTVIHVIIIPYSWNVMWVCLQLGMTGQPASIYPLPVVDLAAVHSVYCSVHCFMLHLLKVCKQL